MANTSAMPAERGRVVRLGWDVDNEGRPIFAILVAFDAPVEWTLDAGWGDAIVQPVPRIGGEQT